MGNGPVNNGIAFVPVRMLVFTFIVIGRKQVTDKVEKTKPPPK